MELALTNNLYDFIEWLEVEKGIDISALAEEFNKYNGAA